MHPRDHRCGTAVDGLAHPVQPHRVLDVLVEREVDRGALPLDVGACAEALALAGQHHRACVPGLGERFGQLRDQLRVEGVAALGARQRDAQHVSVPFTAQPAHGMSLKLVRCSKAH